MRGDFPWLRPVRPHVRPSLRDGRGPHARAVRGRSIASTKVRALPESLGQCKLLEELCVPRPPPPPPCAFAAVPALRCGAWRCRAWHWGRAARRWMRRSRPSPACAPLARASRPARVRGGPEPPGVGAQGRVQHRARGAAGGGRVAEPQVPVSAGAAALTRPRRCADVWGRVVSARAPDVHDGVHVCVRRCVRSTACVCVRTFARMRRMHPSVGVGVCVRVLSAERRAAQGGDLSSREHSAHVDHYRYAGAHVHMYACARRMHLARGLGRGRGRRRARRERGHSLIVCHFVSLYRSICICICCKGTDIYMYMSVCVCIYIYSNADICIHVYVCVFMYVYT
jgi:hypothetical protein